MFPIRDHNTSGTTPYVTWLLIAVNVAVFLVSRATLSEVAQQYQIFEWGMIPARLSQGQGWNTVLTGMFLHGGWLHIAGNMLFLWIFGDNIEDAFGHWRYLAFYLFCGVAAAGAQYLIDPASRGPVIGASGAIAGVLGSYFLLFPKARVDVLVIFVIFFRIFAIRAWIVLAIWMGLQLYSGASDPTGESGVAYWEHIGGFATGMLLTVPLWLRRRNAARPLPEPVLAKSSIPMVRRSR
ncbi:MAG: rhomboid family intramembrane serine protease [Paracoccaceae bacterium]